MTCQIMSTDKCKSVFVCCDENKHYNLKIVLEDLFSVQIKIFIHIKC